jgi:ribosome-binding factor A
MTVEGHRPTHRPERVAEEIRNEVLLLLAGDLKDPRLALAGLDVTEVRVSPNLKQVRVFVRVLGDAREKKLALDGLRHSAGYVRHELLIRLRLRRAPDIFFMNDESESYGQHIDELLRKSKGSGGPG